MRHSKIIIQAAQTVIL